MSRPLEIRRGGGKESRLDPIENIFYTHRYVKSSRISINDVAKRAGVSITSVSRIINNVDYPVSADIRSRVEDAVRELNYLPNAAAQGLRSTFSNVIGMIVRDIENSHFAEIAKGATERAMAHGYLCFVCNTGRSATNELSFHELLWKHRVQGIILSGGGLDSEDYRQMLHRQLERGRRFGLRLVSCAPQGVDIPLVSIDYKEVARLITANLADAGHRRIAFVTGREDVLTCRDHVLGYRGELAARGIPHDPNLVGFGDFTEEAGYELCRALLDRGTGMTAICCGSDPMAVGVIHALSERGLSVPRDISVAGIGDMPMSRYLSPPLTSVRIPRYEIGVQAVEAILAEDEAPSRRILPVALVERQSVKRLIG